MTIAIDTTTSIAAPPDAVWAALTDWSLAPRWMPGVSAMTGPVAPGSTVTFTVRGKERTALVDGLDAPRAARPAVAFRTGDGACTPTRSPRPQPAPTSAWSRMSSCAGP